MKLFALNASAELGQRIAEQLGRPLASHEEREFSWGEHKVRPLVDVWNEDIYVVSSLHGDRDYSVNDKVCRLAFFVGALKDAGARQLTAVVPFLAYSRKDRRTKLRDPVSTRYLSTMLQSVGVDRIVTMDVLPATVSTVSSRPISEASRRPGCSSISTRTFRVGPCQCLSWTRGAAKAW